MPGKKDYKGHDNGYFGRGIYTTENIVYASIYSNDYSLIKFNEAISVIGCQSICRKDKIVDIENMDWEGIDIDEDIKKDNMEYIELWLEVKIVFIALMRMKLMII